MIEKKSYKKYKIYYEKNNIFLENICQKIIDGDYIIIEKFKDTERNFVGKIKINNEIYILKSPKAETIIPQRKIQTILKKGEGLTTLVNLSSLKNKGLDFFIVPLAVIIEKNFFIKKSFILMDYIEGEILQSKEDIDEVLEIIKKLHKNRIYHGDLNTSNFIKTKEGLKIIDTQGKKEYIGSFKRNYDILTLKKDLLVKMLNYDIEKKYKINKISLGYILAFLIKEFKYLPFIEKIRRIKQKLRNKGWKI